MEENVALDTSKQKQFVKSIKGIKKLIKKTEAEVPETAVPKPHNEKKPKRKRPERGLVYLSHIPHGFYEHEMTQYFSQFGAVSNVRVIRSKRTGNSKGFAFVEFKQPAVAEIVAETMNNYLMGKRLIKAALVPPEKQKPKAMRKHWSRFNNPGRTERLKQKKAYNENRDQAGELARARKTFSLYKKNMKKLTDLGINYDFFTPVDIPEELMENKDSQKIVKHTSKKNKDIVVQTKDKVQKKETTAEAKKSKKEAGKVEEKKVEHEKKKVPEPVVCKKEQKQKQQKLKDSGVKPPENFIKIQEDDDSDSSADFDSDDYDKMLENESDVESGDESDDEDSSDDETDEEIEQGSGDEFEITGSDDDSEADESEDEEVPPPKKGKAKLGPIAPPVPVPSKKQKSKQQDLKALQETQSKSTEPKGPVPKQTQKVLLQKEPKVPQMGKRKTSQKNAVSPKKPKFEKQTQHPMKKQFKKKK